MGSLSFLVSSVWESQSFLSCQEIPKLETTPWSGGGQVDRQVRPLHWLPALALAPALGVTLGKLL